MPNANNGSAARIALYILWCFVPTVAIVVLVLGGVWWWDRPIAELERDLVAGAGDTAAANRILDGVDEVLARQPESRRALALKARALTALERFDEACYVFSRISVHTPDEILAYANALVYQRRWNEALPLLHRLLELNPNEPLALRHITTCQFQLGQNRPALESAARLAKIRGYEAEGLFLCGVIHRANEDTTSALECWEKIDALRPTAQQLPIGSAEFFLIYGEDLLAEGKPRLALLKLQQSRERDESVPVLLRLGKANAITGNLAQATEAWTRVLARDKKNEEARIGLAELALHRGDAAEALQWLTPIADGPGVSSVTAYLMERAHTLLGTEDELERWQRLTADLRKAEKVEAALKRKFGRS